MSVFSALVPTVLLTAGILAVLFVDILAKGRHPRLLAWFSGAALAGVGTWAFLALVEGRTSDAVLLGSLRMDRFAVVLTLFFSAAGLVTTLAAFVTEGDRRPPGEFHALLLGAVLGMSVLAAAVDLVTLYLAFETVSITGYVLVGLRRGDRLANEASMKYVLFGAVSSGLMLYGLSLVVGLAGGTSLESVRAAVAAGASSQPAFVAAVVLVFAGFAFKVSAVPFQFWAPDVYQGAPTPIGGFLAVASKAAGFAALVRVAGPLGMVAATAAHPSSDWLPHAGPLATLMSWCAVVTMTLGNFAACRQRDLKRLLAYSSIAHAGYMLMAIAVWTPMSLEALVFYLVAYLFMNLAAFLLAGLVIRETGSSDMASLRGLGARRPWLAASFTLVMLSLTGIPPMFGFVGKFVLFQAVLAQGWVWFAVVGLLNGAVSLYYYAMPLLKMYLEDADPADAPAAAPAPMSAGAVLLACVLVIPVAALFLCWGPIIDLAKAVVPTMGLFP